jgi:GTP cyclohydrolase I
MDRAAAAKAIDDFLVAIGRDPASEPELRGTGARVADAFVDELCQGYAVDADELLRRNVIAADASGGVDGSAGGGTSHATVVELRDVAVTTTCPHHLMAGVGTATVGFAPGESLVGVGSLARLLHAFARRLTLQETIGEGVVAALERNLAPRWAACRIEMAHACMTARGERAHGARLVTFALRARDEAARQEAIAFVLGATSKGAP